MREEGFLVETAADGLTGWHTLKSASWDLVVLDWWVRNAEPRPAREANGLFRALILPTPITLRG